MVQEILYAVLLVGVGLVAGAMVTMVVTRAQKVPLTVHREETFEERWDRESAERLGSLRPSEYLGARHAEHRAADAVCKPPAKRISAPPILKVIRGDGKGGAA